MTNYPINDPHFRVEVLAKTERPNLVSYLAMHQDYCEHDTFSDLGRLQRLSDSELGKRLVERCVKYGHWGVLEHPSITLNVIGFPHSVMVQARTHRVGISFDVQSQRYTGQANLQLGKKLVDFSEYSLDNLDYDAKSMKLSQAIKDQFYFRPLGQYFDREGNKYTYDEDNLSDDIYHVWTALEHYYFNVANKGYAPEHARDMLPQNIRQDFVVTFNARSLLHFCDLRLPSDSQIEIRTLAEMLFEQFKKWMPECAEWYEKHRARKNKLAP